MIIKQLYLYWYNSDWLWKSEKFFLFLMVTLVSSLFNTFVVSLAHDVWFPNVHIAGFDLVLTTGLTWMYFIGRWCRLVHYSRNKMIDHKTGKILKETWFEKRKTAKAESFEQKMREHTIALGFAQSIKNK